MIKVLFFAQLREQLQCGELSVALQEQQTTTQLREYLIQQHPAWGVFLQNENLLVAVNQTLIKTEQQLFAGDEVAFFPPVTGG